MIKRLKKWIGWAVGALGTARPSERARFPLRGVSFSRVACWDTDGASRLLLQGARNISWCQSEGGVVDEKHRLWEVGSGLDVPRPVMDRLWSLVANEEVDAVFVQDMDRLYRDPVKLLAFCEHCEKHNVGLRIDQFEHGWRAIALDGALVVPGAAEVVAESSAGIVGGEAGLVRSIFRMASDGFSPREIARRLKRSDD